MMPAPLEWELRLKNEVSEAARAAGLGVKEFTNRVHEATAQLNLLREVEELEGRTAHKAKEEHEGFFGDMLEAEVIGEQVRRLVDRIEELGEEFVATSIEAVDFDYKTSVALDHMTGSAEQAKDIMESAKAFANGVGEDLDKTLVTFQKLAETGLRGDNLTAAAAAAKDLATVSGQSFESTSALFEMIGSDKGLGGKSVRQLAQFPQLLNELEKHFGFVPGTAKSFEQLSKHLTDAPVKGAAGLHLLEEEILKVAHEDQLGDVGVKIGDSFSGSAERIKNDWKEALGSISEDPAIDMIRSDLAAITAYFDPASEGGKELAASLNGIAGPAEELFGFLKENRGTIADALSAGITSAKFVMEGVVKVVEVLIEDMKLVQQAGQYLGALWETKSFKKAGDEVSEYAEDQAVKQRRSDQEDEQRRMSPAERKEQAELEKAPAAHELPAIAPIPSKDDGGSVMSTGIVTVHEGEEIVPADVTRSYSESSSSLSTGGNEFHFHISVPEGSGQMDEQLLATKMAELAPGAILSALEQMNQMKGGR
jgi:hypothetical protein